MRIVLTEKQMENVISELFDGGAEPKPEKLSEKHYDEFVRLFHRLKELKDIGIIKPEEFNSIQTPMFDILIRIKTDVPSWYHKSGAFNNKED
jgi:hypothetical protein